MCELEGGPTGHPDPRTVNACHLICTQCIDMGKPFCQVDPQCPSNIKFMWFELIYRETFTKQWQEITTQ
eukprot:5023406-Pyramimonas_sp.AAC.1